jgi:hypothetical protein
MSSRYHFDQLFPVGHGGGGGLKRGPWAESSLCIVSIENKLR